MTNKTFLLVNPDGSEVEWIEIDRGNGEFTSMAKALYDTLPSNFSIPQAGE